MKVISGILRGREIKGYDILGTRPTMDRVKESVFAMIQGNVSNGIVLDLFSGSGNYGIEALSNYAKLVYFNDYNKVCIKVIKDNLKNFNMQDRTVVLNLDYKKCLKQLVVENKKFDLIFLDPPYKMICLNEILEFISKNNLLNSNGLVVCEFQDDKLLDSYLNLEKIKERKYGEKEVYIYKLRGK